MELSLYLDPDISRGNTTLSLKVPKGPDLSGNVSGDFSSEVSLPVDLEFSTDIRPLVVEELDVSSGNMLIVSATDSVQVSDIPAYGGPYELTPTLGGFQVGTGGKRMVRDVDVLPIPVSKVSNLQGGYTYTIG